MKPLYVPISTFIQNKFLLLNFFDSFDLKSEIVAFTG